MQIDLKSIFYPRLTKPIAAGDFQKGILVIAPLLFISFFYLTVLPIVFVLLTIISSRRLADLLGEEFYASNRAVGAWILLAGLFCIPFVGMPLSLWVLCFWDRGRVRGFLRDFFEVAELI